MKTINSFATVETMEAALLADGFSPGIPAHITPAVLAIDEQTTRRRICPRCRMKRMHFKPFRRQWQYRGLACCKLCGCCEEV